MRLCLSYFSHILSISGQRIASVFLPRRVYWLIISEAYTQLNRLFQDLSLCISVLRYNKEACCLCLHCRRLFSIVLFKRVSGLLISAWPMMTRDTIILATILTLLLSIEDRYILIIRDA